MADNFNIAATLQDRAPRSRLRFTLPVLLALALIAFASACADIEPTSPEAAGKLAELRANLERGKVLEAYQQARKREAERNGLNSDIYDDVRPLEQEQKFKDIWEKTHKRKLEESIKAYNKLSKDVVDKCTISAQAQAKAGDFIDACVTHAPEPKYNPLSIVAFCAIVLVAGVGAGAAYRMTRRRIDPVAQAGQKLQLAVVQSAQQTLLSGEYKGFAIKVEASAPEAGEGDSYLRAIILSKVDTKTVVRFGPLAPPTGLDLPDLDAPEVSDPRVPEGSKLRLSEGSSAEALLSGDVGFQLRAFDPVDVRVHDGMAGVTCWIVPSNPDKVIEFIEIAVAVGQLYPPA